ncbi:HTTM domain-containing protein [Streptomyces sp. Z26]|uniref:HTTM domain-containing protein n=1 Tax=Streptomyces sp. Z26 TaxID=2500177 RepID=UPI001F0C87A9|nr:HTTM domain-containing protein [Streptomyces sp. Z26]
MTAHERPDGPRPDEHRVDDSRTGEHRADEYRPDGHRADRTPPPPPPFRPAEWRARAEAAAGKALARVTGTALGPYQAAVVRIGFAATWLLFLLRELPHRRELYGPESPWGWELAERLNDANEAFSVLMWTESGVWFECVYALAVLASAALLLGWRTRTMSVLFMVGVLSLQNRSIFMGDGGDNVIHLMSIYLVLTRCGRVWSLDARRAARTAPAASAASGPTAAPDAPAAALVSRDVTGVVLWTLAALALAVATFGPGLTAGWALVFWGLWAVQGLWWLVCRRAPGEPRAVCDIVANLVHNGTMVVIMAEVCFIYATAGWYKIQGSRWQDGTAAYYPMKLDYFAPWPALNDLFVGNGLMIMIMTYGTVIVQVAFPFTLFNRRVKNVLLFVMIVEHLSIAVLLGLPFFSLAMIAADAVFLPTVLLVWLGTRASGLAGRLRRGTGFGARGEGVPAGDAGAGSGAAEDTGADTGAAPAVPHGRAPVPAPTAERAPRD